MVRRWWAWTGQSCWVPPAWRLSCRSGCGRHRIPGVMITQDNSLGHVQPGDLRIQLKSLIGKVADKENLLLPNNSHASLHMYFFFLTCTTGHHQIPDHIHHAFRALNWLRIRERCMHPLSATQLDDPALHKLLQAAFTPEYAGACGVCVVLLNGGLTLPA